MEATLASSAARQIAPLSIAVRISRPCWPSSVPRRLMPDGRLGSPATGCPSRSTIPKATPSAALADSSASIRAASTRSLGPVTPRVPGRRHPAIDDQRVSNQVVAGSRCEIDGGSGHIVSLPEALGGDRRRHCLGIVSRRLIEL